MTSSHLPNPKRGIKFTGVVVLCAVAGFLLSAFPNKYTSAEWVNFMGALAVAIGGVFGCLSTYDILVKETRPATWAFVVLGGAIIAGASVRMAVA